MEEASNRDQTFMEKMHDIGTNFMFSLSGISFRSSIFKKDDEVVFQGTHMNENKQRYDQNLKDTLAKFQNTIWITYRKNFSPLLGSLSIPTQQQLHQYISDTGWGCMVRVGQMTFAEAIRRHLVTKRRLPKQIRSKEELADITAAFLDDDGFSADIAPYSIQKIAKIAFSEFNLIPGEWYTPSRICYILGILHNEKKAMPNTDDLKIALFSSSQPIVFEDFLESMCKIDAENGKHNRLCREECPHSIFKGGKQKRTSLICPDHHEDQFSLLAFIVCRIGVDSPEKGYLKMAIRMMDFKCSLGMIGGRPRKALYFLGRVGEDFIYLDPHYVQESSNHQNILKQSQLESFFCRKFQLYPAKNIDSSFSFAFYFANIQELNDFYVFMQQLKQEDPEFSFLMFKNETPKGQPKGTSSNILSPKNIQRDAEERARKAAEAEAKKLNQIQEQQKVQQQNKSNKNAAGNNNNNNNNKNTHDDDDDDFEIV